MPLAKRFLFESSNDVPSTPISPPRLDLPQAYDPFIDPGTYAVYDDEFDCSLPGLYRWKVLQEQNVICRIVKGDLYETISAMCWARTHGNTHNHLPVTGAHSLSHYARAMKLRITCGHLVIWMRHWLPNLGHPNPTRKVSVLTLEPYNNFDDGHIVVEVEIDGEWRMFDVANGVYFEHEGRHIDHVEFMSLLSSGVRPEMKVICPMTYNAELYDGLVCYGSYADMAWRFEEDRWSWYERIFQSVDSIS